ncbi:MAG: hypothetical protein WCO93_11690 [bacterium]
MNFDEFRRKMYGTGCFTPDQAVALNSRFDKNNLVRWVSKKFLVKLRNGHYCFSEYLGEPNFSLFIANRIYRPSYISLHSALSFYGLIPESVVQVTSVTTLKTSTFINEFGTFSYKTINPRLMFGYETRMLSGKFTILLASPEKALLDLLYLYPFYNTSGEFESLRLDREILNEIIDKNTLQKFVTDFKSKAVDQRLMLLRKTYGL